jgi:predicted dehydrogenase
MVSAVGGAYLQKSVEDVTFISLRYEGRVFASIRASWLDPKKVRQISVVGSRKMVTWDDLDLNAPVAIYDRGANAEQEYNDFGEFLKINMWDGDVRLPKVHMQEPLKIQAEYFVDSIENGGPRRSNGEFGLGVVKVLEGVRESMEANGSPVRVRR